MELIRDSAEPKRTTKKTRKEGLRTSDSHSCTRPSNSTGSKEHRSAECTIDMPTDQPPPAHEQPLTKTNGKKITCRLLICQFAIGLVFSFDMWKADGMCPYAVACGLITVLGCLLGLRVEIMLARRQRSSWKETAPALRASMCTDLLPTILVAMVVLVGPNCAYVTAMSKLGSLAIWMVGITLVNAMRNCCELAVDRKKLKRTIYIVPFVLLMHLFVGLCVFQQTVFLERYNCDCTRHTATFRITAETVYPIVDRSNTSESSIVPYQFETVIEAEFTTIDLLLRYNDGNNITIEADCRRLAGFDRLFRMERDESCTLIASTMDPLHGGSNLTPEFSLDISIRGSDGVVRSVPFCPRRGDEDMSLDYRPNPSELQKLFRAYCRLGSEETVHECPPTMGTTEIIDESQIAALFDCTRKCFARPSTLEKKKPMIRFKPLVGRLVVEKREYELEYKKAPLCL